MAIPVYYPITGTGTLIVPLDFMQSPFNMSYAVEVPGGVTISFTAQYTLDDPNDPTWPLVWLADPVNGGVARTASAGGSYTTPIRALQITTTALSGGNARLAIIQAMSSR
jgi:hypothetical protein